MAFYPAKDSTFEIDDTGAVQRDISAYIISIDGLPGPRELIEVTALGDTGRTFIPGLENGVITLELQWSEDASVGPDTVLGALRTHTAAVDFEYGPEGNASTDIMYTGTCWVRNFQITSRVGTQVTARCELQVEGAVSRAAHS